MKKSHLCLIHRYSYHATTMYKMYNRKQSIIDGPPANKYNRLYML